MAEKYSIRDLEKLSGVKAHTIRIWEKRYNIIEPGRSDSNIRYYTNEDLRKLLNISILNQHGHKISVISKMTEGEIEQRVAETSHPDQKGKFFDNLILSLLDLDELRFNQTFTQCLMTHGFEDTMISVVFPFLNHIGIMWQSGAINPAQEHFFSNLIRHKIIAATETLPVSKQSNDGSVLLFLPDGELHELGLLFYNYVFKKRGYNTIYLGQSVPVNSLPRIASVCRPAMVVTGMTNPVVSRGLDNLAAEICAVMDKVPVYFTGLIAPKLKKGLPSNARSVNDLLKLLNIN